MQYTGMQEWAAFALAGIALTIMGLLPTLPAGADAQVVAIGSLLLFSAATGLFLTSRTMVDALVWVERTVSNRLSG